MIGGLVIGVSLIGTSLTTNGCSPTTLGSLSSPASSKGTPCALLPIPNGRFATLVLESPLYPNGKPPRPSFELDGSSITPTC